MGLGLNVKTVHSSTDLTPAFALQSIIAGGNPATVGLEARCWIRAVAGNDVNGGAGRLKVQRATLQINLATSMNMCVVCILWA